MTNVAMRHNQASRRLCALLTVAGLSTPPISLAPMRYLCILMPHFRRMAIKIMRFQLPLDLKSLHPPRLSVDPTLYTCGLIAHE